MTQKTKLQGRVFEETLELLNKLERELSLFKNCDAPSLAPEQQNKFDNGLPHAQPSRPEATVLPVPHLDGTTQPPAADKVITAISNCPKCDGHAFERGLVTPQREQRSISVLQCASCGAVIGPLDSAEAIEDLRKQIAALDAVLTRIVNALSREA